MKYYLFIVGALFLFNGCYRVGYQDFVNSRNTWIGEKAPVQQPYKFDNAGKPRRGDLIISGQGFTHITKGKDGNLIYHWSEEEVLPGFYKTEWVGKCLTYEVVDPKTKVIKAWGFDKGGNPQSCRTWP